MAPTDTTPAYGTARDHRAAAEALAALEGLEQGTHEVRVSRSGLRLSNLHKVLFPADGTRKVDLLRDYAMLAPALLPHARGRALTLKRYPDGVEAEPFFQKRAPQHRPDWVHVSDPIGDQRVSYVQLDDVRTLLWVANLASIELHVLLSKARAPQRPTALVFDLDPGEGTSIVECCEVGLLVRELLGDLELDAQAKTSGSKGLQVYVPLNTRGASFERSKPFSKAVAELLAARHPDLVVSRQAKALRRGKVLIDWSQNDESKTTVCAYSIRAKEHPRVSTPVTWGEVEACAGGSDPEALRFEAVDVVERLREHGDLFAPVLEQHQALPAFLD